jgi:hypothetical protein
MSRHKGPHGSISAKELMAELEGDPQHVEEMRRQDSALQRKEAEWRKAEAPLVEELRGAGWEIGSAWEFVNTSDPYPRCSRSCSSTWSVLIPIGFERESLGRLQSGTRISPGIGWRSSTDATRRVRTPKTAWPLRLRPRLMTRCSVS